MECKVAESNIIWKLTAVLIETLWNVKVRSFQMWFCHSHVLIETLWNVKLSVRYENTYEVIVLIETLWNVKEAR